MSCLFPVYEIGIEIRMTSVNGNMIRRNLGRFSFIQNFRKFGNSGKWYKNFPEKLPEIPQIDEFQKCEPFNRKILEIRGSKLYGKKTFRKKLSKIWVYLARLSIVHCPNDVPFINGSCRKFKPDVLVERKVPLLF